MSTAFLPRAVAKTGQTRSGARPNTSTPHAASGSHPGTPILNTAPPDDDPSKPTGVTPPDRDPAVLVSLALSDHALWTDPSLRDPNREGFISLSSLLRTAPFTGTYFSEAVVVKTLRTHARDVYDVRMIVTNPARSSRLPSEHRGVPGGYEIRRKDWESVVQHFTDFNRAYWQSRIVYVENIPTVSRSMAGVSSLLTALLLGTQDLQRIQHIVFPPHFQDEPQSPPKCKGFALVTLSHLSDVEQLLSEWPWELRSADNRLSDAPEEAREAAKAGLRTLSKTRWEQLQDEYAACRQKLLAQTAETSYTSARVAPVIPRRKPPAAIPEPSQEQINTTHERGVANGLSSTSSYPPDCVVYIRNVLPETNKTTLRTLFSAAFQEHSELPADGLDYVDYTKGLDTCYLRLTTPQHAEHLVVHFTTHPTAQSQPLDAVGVASDKPMLLELLQGRKEEIYWGQVPEKVRRQAVAKAMVLQEGGHADDEVNPETSTHVGGGRKRRKRQ